MVRTSTARSAGYICPNCKDRLSRDRTGRGYVSHLHDPDCGLEKGQRDDYREWRAAQNGDNGSLPTGDVKLEIGTTIQIRGEESFRTVTYVMGSNRNGWRACSRGQGAVPTGSLEWRIVDFANPDVDSPVTPPEQGRSRWLKFSSLKTFFEFAAAVLGTLTIVVAFLTWLLRAS